MGQFWMQSNTLNEAWGNIFWSMQYQNFQQIELPNLTVTEANPAHCLDFRRYSSDQVAAFNSAQCAMIRRHCKTPISHNYSQITIKRHNLGVAKITNQYRHIGAFF